GRGTTGCDLPETPWALVRVNGLLMKGIHVFNFAACPRRGSTGFSRDWACDTRLACRWFFHTWRHRDFCCPDGLSIRISGSGRFACRWESDRGITCSSDWDRISYAPIGSNDDVREPLCERFPHAVLASACGGAAYRRCAGALARRSCSTAGTACPGINDR